MGRVVDLEECRAYRDEARARNTRVVFTNGCFDLLHRGHLEYLRAARELGGALIVGLNDDESVRRLKGAHRPLVTADDRAHLVAALEPVDRVVIFAEETPARIIAALEPDVLVKGGDYTLDEIVGRDFVERSGGQVHVIELLPGRSTTAILEAALRGLDPTTKPEADPTRDPEP